ncbi:hypothetical protein [Geminisphaera colitermitum]|uniref:hypothetical protein n=1 Tax=Geminisphaera colitermitum TaxID=1148786 RepID=UPI0009DE82AD|nr:hypothetical protein [Geminisphaera colitermitum]
MSEWYDYFEDFPEENPANYVGDRFDPQGAQALRAQQARFEKEQAKFADEQAKLNAKIARIIKEHAHRE